jgi:hypothetical protein
MFAFLLYFRVRFEDSADNAEVERSRNSVSSMVTPLSEHFLISRLRFFLSLHVKLFR